MSNIIPINVSRPQDLTKAWEQEISQLKNLSDVARCLSMWRLKSIFWQMKRFDRETVKQLDAERREKIEIRKLRDFVQQLGDALGEVAPEVRVVEQFRVVDDRPVNQASLGVTRYPITHLIFERSSC